MEPNRSTHVQIARLVMQHRAHLYGFIFACVRNHSDAEDILQNVSVAVVESFEQQLADESGFLPWAREIARRRILAHRRVGNRQQVLDPELVQRLADAAAWVEAERDANTHRAAFLECLEGLSSDNRRIIAMRYDDSCEMNEMAKACGRSVQGIYALVKRIKQLLRECVERRLSLGGNA